MPRTRDLVSADFPRELWERLQRQSPELCEHGRNYAIEFLICEELLIDPPPTPTQRRQAGAEARGKQLLGKPALSKKKKI